MQDRAPNFRSAIDSVASVQIDVKSSVEEVILHVSQVNDPGKRGCLHTLRSMVTLCCAVMPAMLRNEDSCESLDVSMLLCDDDEWRSWRATVALHCEETADMVETG